MCNWSTVPINHHQNRNLLWLDCRMIKAATVVSVSSTHSFSKETCFSTFICQFRFYSLLCFQLSRIKQQWKSQHCVYQRSLHHINNDVTAAIINTVHILWSAACLQQNVAALVFLDWWGCVQIFTHKICKELHCIHTVPDQICSNSKS